MKPSPEDDEQVFIRPADAPQAPVSRRLIEAFARGEVTKGGMAEAGWFEVGRLADDGPEIG